MELDHAKDPCEMWWEPKDKIWDDATITTAKCQWDFGIDVELLKTTEIAQAPWDRGQGLFVDPLELSIPLTWACAQAFWMSVRIIICYIIMTV